MEKLIYTAMIFAAAFSPASFAQDATEDNDTITITGRVEHAFIGGGGFYSIKGDDGTVYRPERLSNRFQRDGLRVKATARIVDKGKGLIKENWDVPVEIIQIDRE